MGKKTDGGFAEKVKISVWKMEKIFWNYFNLFELAKVLEFLSEISWNFNDSSDCHRNSRISFIRF